MKGLRVLWSLVLAVPVAGLAIVGSNSVSVTNTATTVTLSVTVVDLTIINDQASANELYAQVFSCGETIAAATVSSPIRLEPGEFINLHHGQTEPGAGYCGLSLISAPTETATARYLVK